MENGMAPNTSRIVKNILIQPKSLIFIFISIALIISVSAVLELSQSRDDMYSLMTEQSHSLLETMTVSSRNALRATEELEYQIEERLLNNAVFIKDLYNGNKINSSILKKIANNNDITRINIFNSRGNAVYSSGGNNNEYTASILKPIFNNELDTLFIRAKEETFQSGYRFAVAIAAADRGAVVISVDASLLTSFRKDLGFGKIISEIARNENIVYIALQDSNNIIAASGNTDFLNRITDDAVFTKAIADSSFQWHITPFGENDVFEAVHPFIYNSEVIGVFRIGLSLEPLNNINDRIVRRIIIIGFILFIFGSVIISLIFIKQNFETLQGKYKEIENYSNRIITNTSDAIIVLDREDKVKIFNPAAEKLFDKPIKTVMNVKISDVIDGRLSSILLMNGAFLKPVEWSINKKVKYFLVSKSFFESGSGTNINTILVMRDITDYKSMENQVQRKEKLAAMGELASSVAHEIRNPLNTIGTIAQQLNRTFVSENNEEYSSLSNLVYKEVLRINETVENFLKFSKPLPVKPEEFRLSELFNQVKTQYDTHLKNLSIELVIEPYPDNIVFWDRKQIYQVLLNLFENSIDALGAVDNKKIIVKVDYVQNEIVRITFADTGKGIPKETLNKIFNLYFTTKPKGTGLGLSIVQRIIDEHNGTIDVESGSDIGTVFIIQLPTKHKTL